MVCCSQMRNWNNQNNLHAQNLVNFWAYLIVYLIKWPVILSVIIIYISQVLKQVKNVSFLIYIYQIYINTLILTVLSSTISACWNSLQFIFSTSTGHCTSILDQKVGDKFTNLSKIDFFIECFTADFLWDITKDVKSKDSFWVIGRVLANPGISGISL